MWDYPRPPRVEPSAKTIQVVFHGVKIAETRRAQRVLETSHPPVYYIPVEDIQMQYLARTTSSTFCEWKGQAGYYTITVGDRKAVDAGWFYPDPTPEFAPIRNMWRFIRAIWTLVTWIGEQVQAQPGDFYGGWITSDIVGPFKGESGTRGW